MVDVEILVCNAWTCNR